VGLDQFLDETVLGSAHVVESRRSRYPTYRARPAGAHSTMSACLHHV
jgi:hypothetical protein